jgi:hypothetical protein
MVVIDKVHRSWASATTAWQQHGTTSRGKTSSSSGLDSTMHSVADRINDAYDDLVDVLGKQFVKGDGTLISFLILDVIANYVQMSLNQT